MPAPRFRVVVTSGYGRDFVHRLNEQDAARWIRQAPGTYVRALPAGSSTRDALAQMKQLGLDALPLTSSSGHLDGVINRNDVVATILLALTDNG